MHSNIDQLRVAEEHLRAGRSDDAVTACLEVTAKQPTNGAAFRLLAFAHTAGGNFNEAIDAYRCANAYLTNDADLKYSAGYAFFSLQRYDEALMVLDEALVINTNHANARQLQHASMIEIGKLRLNDDPLVAEQVLSRLHKMIPRDGTCNALLIRLFHSSRQKGKLLSLLKEMDPTTLESKEVASEVERVQADPDFAATINQALMVHRTTVNTNPYRSGNAPNSVSSAPGIASVPGQPLQTIACPQCRLQIPTFAAICPSCNFRLNQPGTFAGRDTGPDYVWQEVALTVMGVLALLLEGSSIALAIQLGPNQVRPPIGSLFGVVGAIGVIFRIEVLMNVMKWVIYFRIFSGVLTFFLGAGLGNVVGTVLGISVMVVYGFMLYLLSTEMD